MDLCTKINPSQGYKHHRFQWPRAWRMAFTGKGKRVLPKGLNVWSKGLNVSLSSLLLVLVLAFPALASLPQIVTVSGASTTAYNAAYQLASSTDPAGYAYYVETASPGYYLYIIASGGSYYWCLGSTEGYSSYYSRASAPSPSASPAGLTYSGPAGPGGPPGPSVVASAAPAQSLPTGTFSASPQTIAAGASSTLTWSTSGASSVTLAAGGASPVSVAASGSQSVSPASTTTYEIAATNSAGTVYSDVTVSVLAPTLASVSVSPATVTGSASAGQTVTLTATLSAAAPTGGAAINWSSTSSGGFTGTVGFTSQQIIPAGATQASESATIGASSSGGTVTFTGAYGSGSQSAAVTVGAPAASSSSLPATIYVYGGGHASVNGAYALNSAGTQYTAPSGSQLAFYAPASLWYLYVDGATQYQNQSGDTATHITLTGWVTQAGASPVPTLSLTPQSTGGGSGGSGSSGSGALVITPGPGTSGTMSTGTVTIASAQSGPVVVALTSTAPSVASVPASVTIPAGATAVTFPVTCGSLAVTGFTTISVTLSNGVSQSVIYSVNPGASGVTGGPSDGQSTYTDGTGFASGFPVSSFAAPTLPAIPTLPGVSMPTLPSFSLPGIPALGLPGDLKIGIPGIGSIGIPTGWLTKIIQFAAEAANVSTGMTGSILTAGMQYAAAGTNLAVYNAGAALHNDNVANAAAAHADVQAAVNANAQNTQAVQTTLNNDTAGLETTANQNTLTLVNTTNTNFTNMLTSGPGGLLTQLFQYLFIPDQATMAKLTNELQNFMNWGPYAFITSTLALFQQGPGTVSGSPVLPFARSAPSLETGMNANLSRPHAVYPRQSLPPVPTANPGTDLAIPVMSVYVDNSVVLTPGGKLSAGTPGLWYNTGQSVPFDFSPMTNAKFWPFFRLMEGAGVYLMFGFGIARKLMPKQVL